MVPIFFESHSGEKNCWAPQSQRESGGMFPQKIFKVMYFTVAVITFPGVSKYDP